MNYIGSKLSLLDFLYESIFSIIDDNCSLFCDLFAGTGIVGRYFKSKNFSVIANDIQYYSYVLNKHYIENNKYLNFDGLKEEIKELKEVSVEEKYLIVCEYLNNIDYKNYEEGFIYNNYSLGGTKGKEFERIYFSDENAIKCDAVRMKIGVWFSNKKINENEYYFLLASLLENIDKCANTASVYGAFLKDIKKTALKTFYYYPAEFVVSGTEHKVYNEDANKLMENIKTDILYLDPPYNRRQYSDNYHILETIAKYDNPAIKGKTGLRDDRIKSLYCSKNDVYNAFEELINKSNAKYIFLSYNNEGLLSLEDIKKIMSAKGEYGVFKKEYSRFKADNKRYNSDSKTFEYLHYVIVK
ncbi:modification methylase [Brachyspira hampsonii]|uniref:site-specific DNA-methyltransferase (adenine-specific) n=2 Tax=Brachyspira hampsonii TaxID=1287055 RepID=A0AAC9TV26_9SPIR|nr:DNA adenine methylase [Brachyspira hampsonii]ASJ22043.1 modification methylase [Brachyspira hampsonii]OEJ17734.1 modification methylase [Brachyspira hampsonii]